MQGMIKHTCSYSYFVEVIQAVELVPSVRQKIKVTPFGHYHYFKKKLVVDNHLLDDLCGRWERGNAFNFGAHPRKQLEIISMEIGHILNAGWTLLAVIIEQHSINHILVTTK